MTKHYITPEEHARLQRRRGRQALGLLITILVLVGFVTVLRAGVGLVANLFDDTAQKQEYEDKLEGLVLFDPMPFDGIENIDDLTLREAAVWGCIYNIQETQGGFDNCITGITANREHCKALVESSAALATALCPALGYKKSAEIAKKCMKTGIPVRQIVLDEHLLTEQELDQYLDLMDMTQPGHQVEYHMNFKS